MRGVERSVVGTRPDDLAGGDALTGEQTPVLRGDLGRIGNQRIFALAHQRFAGVGAGPEVHLRLVGRPRLAGRGIIRMVFAESALVETAAGLEGQRHVAGDAHRIDFELGVGDAVRRGEIEVFEHLAHDVFPRIARLVERLAVVGVDLPVIPRHGPEGLDLVHVEIGAPKACDAFVMVENRLAGRSPAEVAEEVVDVTQVLPAARGPARLVVGVEVVGEVLPLAAPSHVVGAGVARGHGNGGRDHGLQKSVGIGLQIALVAEIGGSVDLIGVSGGQEILAGDKPRGDRQNQKQLFHRLHGLRIRT